jgi:phosphatidate cytidylyltransferase
VNEPENKAATSDLKVRTLSGIVMIAIALGALWLGGTWFSVFALLLGAGLLREIYGLTSALPDSRLFRDGLFLFGLAYVALAVMALARIEQSFGFAGTLTIMATVWATDIGAYFAGRAIGGPKIAPKISPSKTWAGLVGGMIAATVVLWIGSNYGVFKQSDGIDAEHLVAVAPWMGALAAVLAQAGDFFESWMKRRAGVKDSGNLIPGHGGLFDRLDGLLPVAIAAGAMTMGLGQ